MPCSCESVPSDAVKVCVTGAAGQVSYTLLFLIGRGDVFGVDQHIVLTMVDLPQQMEVMSGVAMELMDCAFPRLVDVILTDDLAVAFKDIDVAFLVGSMPRKEGMDRKDLLAANVKIFKAQGEALDKYAKKTVQVEVVGNPANTNALICSKFAPSIPQENFTAMTRLDHNRALAQVAAKLHTSVDKVKNVIIWGNHSSTQFPDVSYATVETESGSVPAATVINDDNWIRTEFVEAVQKRGAAVIAARKLSSAMSAAKAAADQMHDIWHGTLPGQCISLGVLSDGSYGVPDGIMFSFPVTVSDKKWTIVKDIQIDNFAREKLDLTAQELLEERDGATSACEA